MKSFSTLIVVTILIAVAVFIKKLLDKRDGPWEQEKWNREQGIRGQGNRDQGIGIRGQVGEVNKPNVTYAAKKTAKELVEHYEREINFNQMTFWQTAVSQNKYVDREVD